MTFLPFTLNCCRHNTLKRLLIITLLAGPTVVEAAANLMVTPSRIVFDNRTRTAQVTLMNQGDEMGMFRISFIRQNMTEDGEFVPVGDKEQGMFSDTMVRYSPRQVTLSPGQSQVVRLMLRKPREMADGEYRSHMMFQTIPKPSTSKVEKIIGTDDKAITVEIIPILGISIPVIVRHGNLDSSLTLTNAQIIPATDDNPAPRVLVDMQRSGNQSVYGDFRVIFTSNEGGAPITIGLLNGVAVYTPNLLRRLSLPLRLPQGVGLNNGKVRILFLEQGKSEKTGLIAETTFSP